MRTIAILTAGGVGSRMKNNVPKQFITVNEIPIIIYTLQQFQKSRVIDQVIIACIEEWHPILRAYSKEFNISKLNKIVKGGNTGIESIRSAFDAIESPDDKDTIIIHDGNRPLVDDDIINRNIDAAKKVGATTTYVDIHDGIVKVDEKLQIQVSDIKREDIKSTQTPHTFMYKNLSEIFKKINDPNQYISLADAATKQGRSVELVKGSETNFKITTPDDLLIFKAVMDSRSKDV